MPENDPDELNEIELLPSSNDNGHDKSWLTIENKTLLNIVYYIKKALYLLIDFIIDVLNKYSKDYRIVSCILAKEKMLLKSEYENSQTPALLGLMSSLNPLDDSPEKPSIYQVLEQKDNT